MDEPHFSIIIATYNRSKLLLKAVESVQAQSYQNWELLVIDDGSKDDTKDAISFYLNDGRIHYFQKENGGPSSARNVGLDKSLGSWICYLDSDDILYPKCLEIVDHHLKENPRTSFAVCKINRTHVFYSEDGREIANKEMDLLVKNPTLQDFYDGKAKTSIGTAFFHKRSLPVRWNESLIFLEDKDFLMQCAVEDPGGYLYIPDEVAEYRKRSGSDSKSANIGYDEQAQAFADIYQLHKDDPLMKNHKCYEDLIKHYQMQHDKYQKGKTVPPKFQFFPELYDLS